MLDKKDRKAKVSRICIWVDCSNEIYLSGNYCKKHINMIIKGYFPEIDKNKLEVMEDD